MSSKQVKFYIDCAVAWFVLLPLCIAGGVIALLCYAIVSEVGEFIVGNAKPDVDNPTTRELARRVCLGN